MAHKQDSGVTRPWGRMYHKGTVGVGIHQGMPVYPPYHPLFLGVHLCHLFPAIGISEYDAVQQYAQPGIIELCWLKSNGPFTIVNLYIFVQSILKRGGVKAHVLIL